MKYLLLLLLVSCSTITIEQKPKFNFFKDYPTVQSEIDLLFISARLEESRGNYNNAYLDYLRILRKTNNEDSRYVLYRLSSMVTLNFYIERLLNDVSQEKISIKDFQSKIEQLKWMCDNDLLINKKTYKSSLSKKDFAALSVEIYRISKLIQLAKDLKIMK